MTQEDFKQADDGQTRYTRPTTRYPILDTDEHGIEQPQTEQAPDQATHQSSGQSRRTLAVIALAVLAVVLLALPFVARSADITVTTLDDPMAGIDMECDLREALLSAALNFGLDTCAAGDAGGTDRILFDPALFPGPLNIGILNLSDELSIPGSSIEIIGPVNASLLVNAPANSPLIRVQQQPGDSFSLSNMVLNGGNNANAGGAMVIESGTAQLQIDNVNFIGNQSDDTGGAIAMISEDPIDLTINDAVFSQNNAPNGSSAIYFAPSDDSSLTLSNSQVSLNMGGVAVFADSATNLMPFDVDISITNSVFEDNTAGALTISSGSNTASRWTTLIDNNRFSRNHNGGIAAFGSIANQHNRITISRNSITDNEATTGTGGMVISHMTASLVNNTIANNLTDARVGGVSFNFSGSSVPQSLLMNGNTLFMNDGGRDSSSSSEEDLFLRPNNVSGSSFNISGNLIISKDPDVGEATCRINAPTNLVSYFLNAANNANCQFNSSNLLDTGLAASRILVTHPVHADAVMTSQTASSVDYWTTGNCLDQNGANLLIDMIGPRRQGNTPFNGNPFTSSGCDAGAIELSTGRALDIGRTGTGSGQVMSTPGGIDCGGDCMAVFADGTDVDLVASADMLSEFSGWTGDCSPFGTAPCMLTMDANRVAGAEFTLIPVSNNLQVTVQGSGSGSITSMPSGIMCPGMCSADFNENDTVTLTPAADPGAVFIGFSGDCTGMTCVLPMSENRSVTATFSLTNTLDVQLPGDGDGLVTSNPAGIMCPPDCSAEFEESQQVTVTAMASANSIFEGFSGDCTGNSCAVTMSADRSVNANFSLIDELFDDGFETP